MPTKPRKVPKAALVGFAFASLSSCTALLPDPFRSLILIGLILAFICSFNYALRRS